jgi:type IV pilus assembly protein PilE
MGGIIMLRKKCDREDGFSLTEVLVVIVIIGILILLALPRFTAVITKAKTTEAKTMLRHLYTLQKAYYYENDCYALNFSELGFEQAPLITEGGEARYKIEILKAGTENFVAQATAVVDFDKDGQYNVWEVNETGKIIQTVMD